MAALTTQEVCDVRMVFDLFDLTNTGSINQEELRKALRLLGFKVSREKVQQLASDVQTPNSSRGATDFNAFQQVITKLQGSSYDKHGEIVQAFGYLDKEGKGYICQSDLMAAGVDKAVASEMVTMADTTGTGQVSQQDFITTMLRTNLFKNHR